MDTGTQVQPVSTSRPLLPLLRVVGDMLATCGYTSMGNEFIDLLSSDIELLAAMQRLAFRVLNQEGKPCQK